MSIKSYAQNFEDVMLWRALGHVESGFYIDLGAQDPVEDSVSHAFHQQGWQGVHVEPTAHYAALLRDQRPGDTVIQAAVAKAAGMIPFFEIAESGISTAAPKIAKEHRKRGFEIKQSVVPVITLAAIFELCGDREIHWLKIDVEGFEKQALASWGKSAARPWIVVVESTLPLTQIENHSEWESFLTRRKYRHVYFDGLNRFYVSSAHPELIAAFQSPPGVFDGFTLSGEGSASYHAGLRAERVRVLAEQAKASDAEIHRLSARISEMDAGWKELQRQAKEKESAFQAQLARSKEERSAIERTSARVLADLQSALTGATQTLARREKEAAEQVVALHQQMESKVAELNSRLHAGLEQAASNQRVYEQSLAAERNAAEAKLQELKNERKQLEATHAANVASVQAELRVALQSAAAREKDLQERIVAYAKAEEEKNIKVNSLKDELRELSASYSARLQEIEKDRVLREQALSQKADQSRQRVDALMDAVAGREQEMAARMLALQQQAEAEKTADRAVFAEKHATDQAQLLASQAELSAIQTELRNSLNAAVSREREHAALLAREREKFSQHQQKAEVIRLEFVRRHQIAADRLYALQQRAKRDIEVQAQHFELRQSEMLRSFEREKDEIAQLFERERQERARAAALEMVEERRLGDQAMAKLRAEHAQQVAALEENIRNARGEIEALMLRQRENEVAYGAELARVNAEHNESAAGAAAREAILTSQLSALNDLNDQLGRVRNNLTARLHDERAVVLELESRLKHTRADVLAMVNSLSWRSTRWLRWFANYRGPDLIWDAERPREPMPVFAPAAHDLSETPSSAFENYLDDFNMKTLLRTGEPPIPHTLEELLAYQDIDFVRNAYRVLLKREADETGELNYLALVRRGIDKLQLLSDIRDSEEGRKVGATLPGLEGALRYRRLCRVPVIGHFLRFSRAFFPPPANINGSAAFESQAIALQGESIRRVSSVGAVMMEMQEANVRLSEELRRVAQVQGEVAVALQEIKTAIASSSFGSSDALATTQLAPDAGAQPVSEEVGAPAMNPLREMLERQVSKWRT